MKNSQDRLSLAHSRRGQTYGVTLERPRLIDLLHSPQISPVECCCCPCGAGRSIGYMGRPEQRLQLQPCPGRWPGDIWICHRSAWGTGVSSERRRVWQCGRRQNSGGLIMTRSNTGSRPVNAETSEFLTWSCQHADLGYLGVDTSCEKLPDVLRRQPVLSMSHMRVQKNRQDKIDRQCIVCTH